MGSMWDSEGFNGAAFFISSLIAFYLFSKFEKKTIEGLEKEAEVKFPDRGLVLNCEKCSRRNSIKRLEYGKKPVCRGCKSPLRIQ